MSTPLTHSEMLNSIRALTKKYKEKIDCSDNKDRNCENEFLVQFQLGRLIEVLKADGLISNYEARYIKEGMYRG